MIETDAQPTAGGGLRKDYAYVFERFFYFLEDQTVREQGIVVFDGVPGEMEEDEVIKRAYLGAEV